MKSYRQSNTYLILISCVAAGIGSILLVANHKEKQPAHALKGEVYSKEGYGGFIGYTKPVVLPPLSSDPLRPAREAYYKGQYKAAITLSKQAVPEILKLKSHEALFQQAQGYMIRAYAHARMHQFPGAQTDFNNAENIADELPDHGEYKFVLGEMQPTLEEEAAFEQVTCISAEGHKHEAEQGYMAFMRQHPMSVLIQAAADRIEHFHGGNLPQKATELWSADMKAQNLDAAMCGPRCMAYIMKTDGMDSSARKIASQMKTNVGGTTLYAMQQFAVKNGWPKAEGVQINLKNLLKQKQPIVAFLKPCHYVVITHMTPTSLTIWDPDGKPNTEGPGSPKIDNVTLNEWNSSFSGNALILR